MNEELEILLTVCARLQDGGIPYMITGSTALNFYAAPRMTRDIDIVIEIQTQDADRMLQLFPAPFYADRQMIEEAVYQEGMFNLIHTEFAFKIDFIIRKKQPYRIIEFSRRRKIRVNGAEIWIVSPEDLILSKLFWAKDSLSELQLGDVRNLLQMVSNLDVSYVEKWVHELKLDSLWKQVQ